MNEQRSMHEQVLERQAVHERAEQERKAERRHRLVRTVCLTVVGLAFLGGVGLAVWQNSFVSESIAQSSTNLKKGRSSSSKDTSSSNLFARQAAHADMATCTDTYAALGDALTAGSRYMVQTETATTDPDKHSMQGLVGLIYEGEGDYSGRAAGMVFASPTTGGKNCEGTMVRVVPYQQSCQAAANLLPKGSRQGQPLAGLPIFALPNAGHAMLLPSGEGCVVLSVVRGAGYS